MKKRTFAILFSLLLIASCVFASCNANKKIFEEQTQDTSSDSASTYETMIRDLENKIIELQQNQYISKSEQQAEITRLQNLLSELKKEQSSNTTLPDTNQPSSGNDNKSEPKFLYTQDGNTAIITGYTGDDTHLVIPAIIDGYTVTAISDSAFASDSLQSVIITNGISKIGWFAFSDCSSLSSITIPSSVSSIGYSAFSSEPSAITIYCHSDSFAQKYAQSYGLSYAVI